MTSDIEMLPLPEKSVIDLHLPTGVRIYAYDTEAVQLYGIAMAEHNIAAKDAEIEWLRMDVKEWKASHAVLSDTCHHLRARADRLEETLRMMEALLDEVRSHFTRDDDLPDDLLPRIDAALAGKQGGVK